MIVDWESQIAGLRSVKNLQSQDTDSSRYAARRNHCTGETQFSPE